MYNIHPKLTSITSTIQQPSTNEECFAKGTLILTNSGYKLVETLSDVDILISSKNKKIPIKKIFSYIISGNDANLFVLKKDSVSKNIPFEDLYMSEYHAYINKNKFYHMCHGGIAEKVNVTSNVIYFHILIDDFFNHNLMANGLEVESYYNSLYADKKISWRCSRNYDCKRIVENKRAIILEKKIIGKKIKCY